VTAILALAGAIIAWQLLHKQGPLHSPLSPLAKAFGEDVQAGRYEQACERLTPESRAEFEAAGGCARSIPATVDPGFASDLVNLKFTCFTGGSDTASLRGDGRLLTSASKNFGCEDLEAGVIFHRVEGQWGIELSPKSPVATVTPPSRGSSP
jgi:hypothetical protein